MKKILVLAIAVAMLASMAVPASAAITADGEGAIVFTLLGDGEQFPGLGGFNPLNPGTNPFPPGQTPNVVWPPFTNNPAALTPTEMQSWSLHFGTRGMPSGAAGARGWASHPDQAVAGATPNIYRLAPDPVTAPLPPGTFRPAPAPYGSLLGILWNTGWDGAAADAQAAGNQRVQVALGQMQTNNLPNMAGFDLRLRPHGITGYTPAPGRPPIATGAGGAAGFVVYPTPADLVQGTGVLTFGTPQNAFSMQTGFIGVEWSGLLHINNWDPTASTVFPGTAQANIRFTQVAFP